MFIHRHDNTRVKIDNHGFKTHYCSASGQEGQVLLVPVFEPQGSAQISVKMSFGTSSHIVTSDLCIDTGADITMCHSAFINAYFGKDALQHLTKPDSINKTKIYHRPYPVNAGSSSRYSLSRRLCIEPGYACMQRDNISISARKRCFLLQTHL
jgi:hypothetical protein